MSARIPVRRLGKPSLAAFRPRSTYWIPLNRPFSSSTARRADPKDLENPILDEYLSKHNPNQQVKRPEPRVGTPSKHSIFQPEYEIPGYDDALSPEEKLRVKQQHRAKKRKEEAERNARREHDLHALSLDPVPQARSRHERKLIIQSYKNNGRVPVAVQRKRTERELSYQSPFFPTSQKKMTMLMRQIAGKTVEDALIQMRFSKKRVARDIVKALQVARDEAVAARGMGLGAGVSEAKRVEEEQLIKDGVLPPWKKSVPYLADGTRNTLKERRWAEGVDKTVIELKDGSKKTVVDPTEIYIDQAWINKGPTTRSPDYRARGKINMLMHRTTSFSVLLKEEKTRMRISDEIKKKRDNRKLWLPLPDRPVTSQRQYCLW